jgi:CHAT domain-containing protein
LLDERVAARAGARMGAEQKPLVVGASLAAGEEELLPEALNEARNVARFDVKPILLVGEEATEPEVMAHLATASALHFAGHAASQSGDMRLLLAPAKLSGPGVAQGLKASGAAKPGEPKPWLNSELLRKHPPSAARLVVFSACSSGKKEPGWNHGMGDLVATLGALGVPDVVATRWQIDSASAVPMMSAFYGGLAEGRTVPQALTAARQTMAHDPRYKHPYYWAAWYASGQGTARLNSLFHKEK